MHTLEETNLAFSAWRSTKAGHGGKIPENLWDMVKELVPHYKKSHICKELHISGAQFNKRLHLMSKRTSYKNVGFAEALLPKLPQADLCELVLQGSHKVLTIKLPVSHLAFILPLMEPYL